MAKDSGRNGDNGDSSDDGKPVEGSELDEGLQQKLDEGWSALEEGDLAAARREALAILADAPEAPEALLLEAACLREEGEDTKAVEVLRRASAVDPEWCTPVLWTAELLASDPTTRPEALRRATKALDLAEEEDEYLNALALKAGLEAEMGEVDKAKKTMRDLPPADVSLGEGEAGALLTLEIAELHMAVGDAKAARDRLLTLTAAEPDLADAWHALGVAAEAIDDHEGMKRAWLRTRELDAEQGDAGEREAESEGEDIDGQEAAGEPGERLDEKEVAAVAEEALRELPERARRLLASVPIIIAELPAREDVEAGMDPRMLGLFMGTPYPENSSLGGQPGLTQIVLFRRNLERVAGTETELREEIRTTLLHETGHFFGMDERELEKVGLD